MSNSCSALPPSGDGEVIRADSGELADSIGHDGPRDSYRTSFDRANGSVAMAVISSVAASTNTPAEELPPLVSSIDTDALEAIFQPGGERTLTFPYHGQMVTVHGDGQIEVATANE